MPIHYRETEYGFEYGSARVERVASDERKGWVVIDLGAKKARVRMYVTKTGKVRVYLDGEELKKGNDTQTTSSGEGRDEDSR